MATTYIGISDLNVVLDGFATRYYGTYPDDGETLSIDTQFYTDMNASYDEVNEWLAGIPHMKTIPVGTQAGGNYPYHVRSMQANTMIFNRLKNKHYGEFTDQYPGWITAFHNKAIEILSAIRGQGIIFQDDTGVGETGIGIGSFTSAKAGSANLFTNWELGIYTAGDYPRTYIVEIDGTTLGNQIGSSTFRWSNNGGYSFNEENTEVLTSMDWVPLEFGLAVRWEPVGTGTLQISYGDRFLVKCVPIDTPQKGRGIKFTTFKRG